MANKRRYITSGKKNTKKYSGGFGGFGATQAGGGASGALGGAMGSIGKYGGMASTALSMYATAFEDEKAAKIAGIGNSLAGTASTVGGSFSEKQQKVDDEYDANTGMKSFRDGKGGPSQMYAKYGMRYTKGKGDPNKKYPDGKSGANKKLSLAERKKRLSADYTNKESDRIVKERLAKGKTARDAKYKARSDSTRNTVNSIMGDMKGWVPLK